jgi:IclR family transcriptional regulator, acetate operon repressor
MICRIVESSTAARLATRAMSDGEGAAAGSQAVARALAVLMQFIETEEAGISELARALKLSPSTVHRIVRALVAAGVVEQDERTNRYYLGRGAVLLGQVAQHRYGLDICLPLLERLAAASDESVNLVMRDGDAGVVTFRVQCRHELRFDQPVGSRVGLHCSASGKAILAFGPDRDRLLASLGPLQPQTPKTMTSLAELEEDLAGTRERGYSIDDEEFRTGVRCVGAPVLDASGHARSAIAVQAPSVRFPRERVERIAPLVRRTADEISSLIPPDRRL